MPVFLYYIRRLVICLSNLVRRLRRCPDYVVITLEGNLDIIALPRKGILARFNPPPPGLDKLIRQLRRVALSRLKGVVIILAGADLTSVAIEGLRDEFAALRKAGKQVILWSSAYDSASYWLATAADQVLLQPGGRIGNLGLSQSALFMGDALEQVGLKLDAVQISPYKSALDRFTKSSMSAEVEQMTNWLLDARFERILASIAAGRNLEVDGARGLVDQSPYTDQHALAAKAVDGILSQEELPQHLGTKDKPARLEILARVRRILPRLAPEPPRGFFALIRVKGAIVDGRSSQPPFTPPIPIPFLFDQRAGDLTIVEQARTALSNNRVKGVLLFVDSGGGSATASEAMTAALDRVASKKPVVAMMGSVAASGGYYVTTSAQWVVASPSTITGSIGVLTAKLVDKGLLSRLLFNRETLTRGERAGMESPDQPYTEEERRIVWANISNIYELFLRRVAKARSTTPEQIDKVGGGRVWTGEQALKHGLVDELGGLDTALKKLRELAKIDAPLREIPVSTKTALPPSGPALYALDSIVALNRGEYHCLCPLAWSIRK